MLTQAQLVFGMNTHVWLGPLGVKSHAATPTANTKPKMRNVGSVEAIMCVWMQVAMGKQ